ncbi:hypothetical protein niasHT_017995 [Heterodera trifolii]|uniref:Thiaminase-2/PQQC domain-containing protein n=1 Tax=Heterodera trifolii TaxID=157864 RepID=A0ABD2LBK7_9BILA
MSYSFSTEVLWPKNQHRFSQICALPIINELIDGTLSQKRFRNYIVQDNLYLDSLGMALTLAASKTSVSHPKGHCRARLLLSHVMYMLDTEVAMHDGILRSVGIESRAAVREKFMPSPTCHHYMSFLIATASQESLAVAIAAMLPCYWVYREVVNWMVAESKKLMDANSNGVVQQHPYQAWFELHANDDYAKSVDDMLALADELAREADKPTRAKMEATFELGFRLEWMFWKTAYEMEEWDI